MLFIMLQRVLVSGWQVSVDLQQSSQGDLSAWGGTGVSTRHMCQGRRPGGLGGAGFLTSNATEIQ